MDTIYRATTDDAETALAYGMCFAEKREVAEKYTDNQGFGGQHIRELAADLDNTLDVACRYGVDFERLAEALGYDDAESVAQDWRGSGYLYPWEESEECAQRLRASGYDWLRYEDDYPEDAVTLMRITEAGE